jgi:hypothetical protein
MAKKQKDWRDELVPRKDFQCACGCDLQLSRGDLADAVRAALPFCGRPRTWGVTITRASAEQVARVEPPEPSERQLCPGCRYAMVEIPTFAAKLLHDQRAMWPICAKCRAESPTASQRHLRLVP